MSADALVTERNGSLLDLWAATATFSPCRTYRYQLTRRWAEGPMLGWVMLNPSTADAFQPDPTVTRCMGFARAWGFAGLVVHNLFALRSPEPRALYEHPDPVGPDNDRVLLDRAGIAKTVCAWGVHGAHQGRDRVVQGLLSQWAGHELCALAITKAGYPGHPLYLSAAAVPVPYPPEATA